MPDLQQGTAVSQRHSEERISPLPPSLPPRGLSRGQAAAYIGVSPSLFDQMVKDGRMPKPKDIGARKVWDRLKVDEAFSCLSNNDANPWDDMA